jgi:hypothetical protein
MGRATEASEGRDHFSQIHGRRRGREPGQGRTLPARAATGRLGSSPVVSVTAGRSVRPNSGGWTIAGAEDLLLSLQGVISARVVAKPGGEVDEIHLLTTHEVTPKQTVRNVESALLAHLDLTVDHRKISVAQTVGVKPEPISGAAPLPQPQKEVEAPPKREPPPKREVPSNDGAAASVHVFPQQAESRILFVGLQVESERAHRVRFQVELEWQGERYRGDASGADLARARMETVANAALRAVEAAIDAEVEDTPGLTLALDGVKTVEAFDRRYAFVAVNAFRGREVTALSGSALIEDSPDKAVILATLQATDRWVRGRT